MSDRELLELAAKAAGIEYWVVRFAPRANPIERLHTTVGGETVEWNPLESDADALRLVVKLGMTVLADPGIDGTVAAQIDPPTSPLTSVWADELAEPDPYAATRRAIVRAAAEIGKAMGSESPKLICPRCGVDRFKDKCPGPFHMCPIHGEAQ